MQLGFQYCKHFGEISIYTKPDPKNIYYYVPVAILISTVALQRSSQTRFGRIGP